MNPKEWIESSNQDGVFYIGHASALARVAGRILLFDPVWNHKPYGDHWEFIPEQINCDAILDRVDAVFVSHIHSDHICPTILRKVKAPILVMEGRPNLLNRLTEFNSNVISYSSGSWLKSELGFEFYFQKHAFNSIDSSVFVRGPKFCMYHGNDNFLNKQALETLSQAVPQIDVALVPYAFIHWYPHLMSHVTEEWRESETTRLNKQSLEQAQDFMHALKVRTAIPFGSALFYAEGPDHILNRTLSKPHDFEGALPLIAGGWIWADGNHSPAPSRDDYEKLLSDLPLNIIQARASKAPSLANHELIVNNVVIDMETLKVFTRASQGQKPFTHFEFNPMVFRKWLKGEISFEEAIGTRQFTCHREPNDYNLRVFEFMNNYL